MPIPEGVPTVVIKNLTKKTIKEEFPVYGMISVAPGAKKRVPLDVAKVWADPNRYDPIALAKIMGGDVEDQESVKAPVEILEVADDGSIEDTEKDKDPKGSNPVPNPKNK